MSQEAGTNTGQQLTVNTDTSKVFLWDNSFDKGTLVNSTYDTIEYPRGTLMGRNISTGDVEPYTSADNQLILGVLNETHSLEDGDEKEVAYCVSGEVAEEMIVLQGSDDLDTVVGGKLIRDKIKSETGIILRTSTENTNYDND